MISAYGCRYIQITVFVCASPTISSPTNTNPTGRKSVLYRKSGKYQRPASKSWKKEQTIGCFGQQSFYSKIYNTTTRHKGKWGQKEVNVEGRGPASLSAGECGSLKELVHRLDRAATRRECRH